MKQANPFLRIEQKHIDLWKKAGDWCGGTKTFEEALVQVEPTYKWKPSRRYTLPKWRTMAKDKKVRKTNAKRWSKALPTREPYRWSKETKKGKFILGRIIRDEDFISEEEVA